MCSFKDETKKKQEKNKTKETEKAVRAAGDTKLYIRRKQKSVNLTNIKGQSKKEIKSHRKVENIRWRQR